MENFVGAPDTPIYEMLRSGRMEYGHWLLIKKPQHAASTLDFFQRHH